ncbi:MAG: hypothetical protein HUJ97_02495 [Bacteroidales bacterium]|mgnify:CR=1 FL=1|nr:hypothetical protein [Bacteroidales bacterium]
MSRTLVCAIQIGSSRICSAAAWRDQYGNYEIAAIETEQTKGCVRKGCIVDIEAAANIIKSLVTKLNNRLKGDGCRGVDAAYIGVNAFSMHSYPHSPSIELEDGKSLGAEAISTLRQTSMQYNLQGLDVLGLDVQGYSLDGIDCLNPIGMTGSQLVARHQLVVALQRIRFAVRSAMAKAGVKLLGIIATPLAVGKILAPDEKQKGCVLVDLGHSLTSVSIYFEGSLKYLATIPFGGNAVTMDIASKGISLEEAEQTKVAQDELDIISRCRYEEIIDNVQNQIVLSGYKDRLAAGCILTGGASLQRGLVSLFGERLGISRIMARGYSGICFGLSDRKPQLSGLMSMIGDCVLDCEIEKPKNEKPVYKQQTIDFDSEEDNSEQVVADEHVAQVKKSSQVKTGLSRFFKDLLSGQDE